MWITMGKTIKVWGKLPNIAIIKLFLQPAHIPPLASGGTALPLRFQK
jgi:hypothetical protein